MADRLLLETGDLLLLETGDAILLDELARRLIFVAHDGADPNGPPLGVLTKAYGKRVSLSAKGTGEGSFTINKHDAEAAWCAPGNFVRVYLDSTDGDPVFAFWLTVGGDRLLDGQNEDGGEVLARGGSGALSYLEEATIWHEAVSGGSALVGTDGHWHWADRHPAAVMVRLLEEAQARGALPDLTWTFTRTLDSDGNPWSQTAASEFKLPIGQDLLSALGQLLLSDFYVRMDPDLTLNAWEEIGTDLVGTVEFGASVNIRESAERRVRDNPLRSVALVQADRTDGTMRFREVEDAVIETLIGRRKEGFLRYEATGTNAVLDRVGLRWLRLQREQYDGPTTLGVVENGERALIDYNVGDTVSVHIPGVFDHQAIVISSIVLVETDGGEYDPIVAFNDEPGIGGTGGLAGHGSVGANTAGPDLRLDLSIAGANLIPNSSFESVGDWDVGSLWSMPFASGSAYAGSRTARASPTGTATGELVTSEFIPVDRTADYWLSFWSYLSAYTAGTARLRLREYDAATTLLQSTDIDLTAVETGWSRHSLHFGPNTVGGRTAFHANTTKVEIVFQVLTTPTLTWEVDGAQFERSPILTAYAPSPYELMDGSITSEKIADAAITTAKFAAGIRPVAIVATLPTLPDALYPVGAVVFLTTDKKLYRNDADTWIKSVDGADIIADSITAGQIAAGAISTSELAANAVTAAKIAAGTITANEIAAAAVETDKLAANAVVTGKLAASAVTADKIAASQIHIGLMADDARNLCPNPNFENLGGAAVNTDGVTIPGWNALGATMRIDNTVFRAGAKCLRITSTGANDALAALASPSRGGARVRARCWVRGAAGNSATAQAGLTIAYIDVNGGQMSTSAVTLTVGTNTAWQELVVDGVTPTDAVAIRVNMRNTASSAAGDITYHDDVRLYFTDEDIDHAGGSVKIDSTGMTITNGKIVVTNPSGTVVIDGTSNMFKIIATGTLEVTSSATAASNVVETTVTLGALGTLTAPSAFLGHTTGSTAITASKFPAQDMLVVGDTGTDNYFRLASDSAGTGANWFGILRLSAWFQMNSRLNASSQQVVGLYSICGQNEGAFITRYGKYYLLKESAF